MENIALDVKEFSFKYSQAKNKALDNISFSVQEGEFFCIIGSNGSGKSTLCNALVGLIPFYFSGRVKGDISVKGIDIKGSSIAELSSHIGLVFQNPFNQLSYTSGSVAEELAYGLGNNGVSRDEMKIRVKQVAKLMRIEHIIDKNPLELSGGQVQRVAFGSTYIMHPSILVLDECTTQLDPLGSEEIFDIVKELNKTGVTVVMVDHDMERVARCADRVLVMEGGRAIALDTPQKIFEAVKIDSHTVDMPDFTRISMALREEKLSDGRITVNEEPTVQLLKEVLAK